MLNSLLHFVCLENIYEAINKLQENYITTEELQSILPSVGITLSDKEFRKIVSDTTQNGETDNTRLSEKIKYFYGIVLNDGVSSQLGMERMGHAEEDSKRNIKNGKWKKIPGKSDLMDWFGGTRPFISQNCLRNTLSLSLAMPSSLGQVLGKADPVVGVGRFRQ